MSRNIIFLYTVSVLLILFLGTYIFSLLWIFFDKRAHKNDTLKNIHKRLITFLWLTPVILIPVYLGKPYFNILVSLLSFLFLYEYIRMIEFEKMYIFSIYLNQLLVTVASYFDFNSIFIYLPIFFTLQYMAMPIFLKLNQYTLQQASLALLSVLYFSWSFSLFSYIYSYYGVGCIIAISLLVTVNDLASYFLGKILGKHKLSNKSPNKTIEGAIGGLIVTIVFSQSIAPILTQYTRSEILWFSFCISILSPMGDLAISSIKRSIGVKDSGRLLPGHGGVLDRFDGWLFSIPILFLLLAL